MTTQIKKIVSQIELLPRSQDNTRLDRVISTIGFIGCLLMLSPIILLANIGITLFLETSIYFIIDYRNEKYLLKSE